jgi:hypothetical protein
MQLLRAIPEARFFFYQAYIRPSAGARDRLRWAHDVGELFDEEGTGKIGSVLSMREASYFPPQYVRGQQDAMELFDLIIELQNDRVTVAHTLAEQLFDFEWMAERVCSVCNHVSMASRVVDLPNTFYVL